MAATLAADHSALAKRLSAEAFAAYITNLREGLHLSKTELITKLQGPPPTA